MTPVPRPEQGAATAARECDDCACPTCGECFNAPDHYGCGYCGACGCEGEC